MNTIIKIAVIGAYGNMNYGDDLLVYCINNIFKNNNEYSIFFVCEENYFRALIPNIKLIKYCSIPFLKPSILLFGGGTQFACFTKKDKINSIRYKNYLNDPVKIIDKIRQERAKWYIKKINIVNALGLGIGPFISDNCRKIERQTKLKIRKFSYLAVRDKLSLQYCIKWKQEKVKLYSDIVYYSKFLNILNRDSNNNYNNEIAIIIRDWDKTDYGSYYEERILTLRDEFKRIGIKYKYVSFSKVSDKKVVNLLLEYGEYVEQWDPEKCSIKNFLEIIGKYNIFLTARYHGAVIASLFDRPFISIDIEPKLAMIADLFDMPKWESPYEIKYLVEIINSIRKNYILYKSKIVKQRIIQEKKAFEMISDYMDYLRNDSLLQK